jgi:imidazolonepropionase-like amidohydrolase
MLTAFTNAQIFDGTSEPFDDAVVVVEDGRIASVDRTGTRSADVTIDCGGRFLMPGLIDAHFHCSVPKFDIWASDQMPHSLRASHAVKSLEGTLLRGFTTVRDAGGGDRGLAMAIERGFIAGPRFFFSGKGISQTGGHGDYRPDDREDDLCGCETYVGSMSLLADGADAVRKAVREQLRKGATQIKIFVSGGGLSASPMWMPQFTDEEIMAAVYETSTRHTYVMAHSHTDESSRRCAMLGVRSIEHGSYIHREETARVIAKAKTFVVPTLSVADVIVRCASELGIPPANVAKAKEVAEHMLNSVQLCERAGVKLGFGTDILDLRFQSMQSGEFALRAEVSAPINVLKSATSVNAELLQMEGQLGCIKPGAHADLLLVDGNPLRDLTLFQNIANLPIVMKAGKFIRNAL